MSMKDMLVKESINSKSPPCPFVTITSEYKTNPNKTHSPETASMIVIKQDISREEVTRCSLGSVVNN